METRWGRSDKELGCWADRRLPPGWGKASSRWVSFGYALAGLLAIGTWLGAAQATESSETNNPAPTEPGFSYIHDQVREKTWSIFMVRIPRNVRGFELQTTLGSERTFGMALVSEQVKGIPAAAGRPVAAINGDFFKHEPFAGSPEGLQILRGELVSSPDSNQVCFWVDPRGDFHRSNVMAQFQVTWPDGTTTPFELNHERAKDQAVLYTSVVGASTRTSGGLEFVLERKGDDCHAPIQAGRSYPTRIKLINEDGNTPMGHGSNWILSLGPKLVPRVPKMWQGAMLQISTATIPDLAGVKTAIGGKPSLVRGGKVNEWHGIQLRHPRAAIGWNKDAFFMVEVDGRQSSSVGMTLPELAEYMAKLGCEEAMNLDGGGSATLWVEGKVMNNPSEGHERPAANALVLVQKPSP